MSDSHEIIVLFAAHVLHGTQPKARGYQGSARDHVIREGFVHFNACMGYHG
ncbi:hypothetical protein L915_14650 [Phytophthora nicotianae]|uniref:Uncharacterized protein n=1 Tax=Phytophthora nicotianae TaxID=4792 RepID=W2IHC3_PHYNI|nr:hypothetical protein L915_14650 [Phytophthora nicotianae]ETL32927.1 hypothetical protein L916_14554 [Phytophthora nicotianae]ETM39349.1 hypothetical protein L914_14497 [Phytophthora nicotianae]